MFEFLFDLALNDSFVRKYDFQGNPRQTALEGVVENYPADPRTLELLHRALNDPDEQVRSFAEAAISKTGIATRSRLQHRSSDRPTQIARSNPVK